MGNSHERDFETPEPIVVFLLDNGGMSAMSCGWDPEEMARDVGDEMTHCLELINLLIRVMC